MTRRLMSDGKFHDLTHDEFIQAIIDDIDRSARRIKRDTAILFASFWFFMAMMAWWGFSP